MEKEEKSNKAKDSEEGIIEEEETENSKEEIIKKWEPNKKELSDELEKALLSKKLKENVLEEIINEEKVILNKLELDNSKLKYKLDSDYLDLNRINDYEAKQKEKEREYIDNSTENTNIKKELNKDKTQDYKFIKFKPSY